MPRNYTYTVLSRVETDGTFKVRIPALNVETVAASRDEVEKVATAAIKRVHELYAKSGHEPPNEEGCEFLSVGVDL